jgi:hypothetical protein
MYLYIKFCAKCGETQISSCAPQTKRVHQGCGLSPYVFSITTNYITDYNVSEGTHSSVTNGLRIPGLLCAVDLATLPFTKENLTSR